MKLLLIDDEEQREFIQLAQRMEIEVIHHRTADMGLRRLEREYWQIDGVILDARQDPSGGFQALTRCLTTISGMSAQRQSWMPVCVRTGYKTDTMNVVPDGIDVFSKTEGSTPELKHMQGIIQNLPAYQVKQKYREDLDACREAKLDDATSPSAGPKRSNADPDACRKVKLDDDTLGHIEEILRNLHGNSAPLEEDYPKHLRTALEWMFRKAICLCLVHGHLLAG
jgi:hypothetical protein